LTNGRSYPPRYVRVVELAGTGAEFADVSTTLDPRRMAERCPIARPHLMAPGRRIVSSRVPGSTIDTRLPDHVVAATNGATYTRLSGTSMWTGIVSGAIALVLQRHPE
jgi:Subtilase family